MKKIVAFILVIGLLMPLYCQELGDTYTRMKLKGPVKQLMEFLVSPIPPMLVEGTQTIDTLPNQQFEFDKNHRETSNQVYINGTLQYINQYTYDTNGRQIEKITFDPTNLHSRITYTYNQQQLSTEVAYDPQGNEIRKIFFEYNTNGKIIRLADNNSNGSINYTYNDQKNEVEMKVLDNGTLAYREISRYDAEGNRIEWIKRDYRDQLTGRYVYKYTTTTQGNEIELTSYSETNELRDVTVYKYDQIGLPTETITYRPDKTVISKILYEYKFDQYGNWIFQNIIGLSEAPYSYIREITYRE